jgi:hypothetical protein
MMSNPEQAAVTPGEKEKIGGQVAERVPCPVCREPIARGARKCTECGSDLGWRRFFIFGNTTLALLTALVSVIGASYPAFKSMLTPRVSVLSAVFTGIKVSGTVVSMLVANRGQETGALRDVAFVYGPSERDDRLVVAALALPGDGAVFVEPGKTLGLNVSMDIRRITLYSEDPAKYPQFIEAFKKAEGAGGAIEGFCGIGLIFINSDGSEEYQRIPMSCLNAMPFFKNLVVVSSLQPNPLPR